MKPRKFEHIGILVADIERSIGFYTEVMGLTLRERRDFKGTPLAFLRLGETEIELVGREADLQGDAQINHLAFTVDDLDAARADVQAAYPEAKFTDEFPIWDGGRICFFNGPDGEKLELFQAPRG